MSIKLNKKERLEIIQQLRYGVDWPRIKENILKYQYQMDPNKFNCNEHSITYQISTIDEKILTSESNLKKKCLQYIQNLQKYKNDNKVIRNQDTNHQFSKRYFTHETNCQNCDRSNHETQFCLQPKKCQYCLCSSHQSEDCTHKDLCTNCNTLGHTHQICDHSYQICLKCERKHNKNLYKNKCYSLTKGNQPNKSIYTADNLNNNKEILCIRCRKLGHLYC